MSVSTKETTKETMFMNWSSTSKRIGFCTLTSILFSIIHLFHEGFGFLLVHKGQTCETFFCFESMEECSILVVGPCIIYLLIPYDTSIQRL